MARHHEECVGCEREEEEEGDAGRRMFKYTVIERQNDGKRQGIDTCVPLV